MGLSHQSNTPTLQEVANANDSITSSFLLLSLFLLAVATLAAEPFLTLARDTRSWHRNINRPLRSHSSAFFFTHTLNFLCIQWLFSAVLIITLYTPSLSLRCRFSVTHLFLLLLCMTTSPVFKPTAYNISEYSSILPFLIRLSAALRLYAAPDITWYVPRFFHFLSLANFILEN